MAQAGIATDVPPFHVGQHLGEDLGKFVGQAIGVHADRHDGNPQSNVISFVRAKSAGARLIFLQLVPVGGELEPVDSPGMKEFFPFGRHHEHPREIPSESESLPMRGSPRVEAAIDRGGP